MRGWLPVQDTMAGSEDFLGVNASQALAIKGAFGCEATGAWDWKAQDFVT